MEIYKSFYFEKKVKEPETALNKENSKFKMKFLWFEVESESRWGWIN